MVQKVTLTIPDFLNNLSPSNFHWTLTLLDRPDIPTRIMYSSTNVYQELHNVTINGFKYEKIIFDFRNRKIHIYVSNFDLEALRTLFHSIIIKSSPTSLAFCLLPHTKPKQNNN